jgi:serine/threonine kinase PknH
VTLVCSYRDGVAAVTWTTDADLRVNDVHSDRFGPSLDQLYQWWSAHS